MVDNQTQTNVWTANRTTNVKLENEDETDEALAVSVLCANVQHNNERQIDDRSSSPSSKPILSTLNRSASTTPRNSGPARNAARHSPPRSGSTMATMPSLEEALIESFGMEIVLIVV